MKKKIIRCVEAKTMAELKKYKYYYSNPSYEGKSYVYYGFANDKSDSKEHIDALKAIVNEELHSVGWNAQTTIPMTVCKIKPQQSQTHAHMTMVKVMVPNYKIVGLAAKKHILL